MVPLNKKLENILNEMYIDRQDGKLFDYHPDTVKHKFKKYLRKSDIKKDVHFHKLPRRGHSRGGTPLHHILL